MSKNIIHARIQDVGGPELLQRLTALERSRSQKHETGPKRGQLRAPDASAHPDYDVVIAGGGLSLLLAPQLADHGLKVAVLERHRAGTVQREWNATATEIEALGNSGWISTDEAQALVIARYEHGVCRWHGGGSYPVRGVLDHAVDATALLELTRQRALERGVELLDGHTLIAEQAGAGGVALSVTSDQASTRYLTSRILVDARGASSPYATADLLCPTVGGVVSGLSEGSDADQIDPRVGEILATTEHVEDGHQHIWEAFPGRPGETTVYLFYYARAADVPDHALTSLYTRFFAELPHYKRGDAQLLRPTFGYIPGWSRLGPAPTAPHPRIVLVGDAAARHSPLTYCGFGHMLRSFVPVAAGIARWLDVDGPGAGPTVLADAPIHAGTGALSMMMSVPPNDPKKYSEINELLDAAFATLHAMGDEPYAALLRDQMDAATFIGFLRRSAQRRPRIYREVLGRLGPWTMGRWAYNLLRERARNAA